jgi:phosphotransferase system enzyme I (PtsI)
VSVVPDASTAPLELAGIGVSPGIAMGPALVIERDRSPVFRILLPADAIPGEVCRLQRAFEASRRQLQAVKERLSRSVGLPHAYIFDAHLLMLDDPLVVERAVTLIRQQNANAEWALHTVAGQLHRMFEEVADPYLRERSTDLDDVIGRVHLNLRGAEGAPTLSHLPGRFVLVASDLLPSEAADLDWEHVAAIVTDAGSPTHHTAILARSFGVPAVAGLDDVVTRIAAGSLLVVDGTRGQVTVDPSRSDLAGFRDAQQREEAEQQRLQSLRPLPSCTRDGVTLRLLANVEFAEEGEAAMRCGAEGIGLFRSEYLLGRRREWPSEDRQVAIYAHLMEQMAPHPVTVRLWDMGAEELAPGGPSSANPALGERALRLLQRGDEPFRSQLRALLRAGTRGPLRILLPFVSGPADVAAARALVGQCGRELTQEGTAHRADVPVGVNIEVPAAALTLDLIAPAVDFVAIGTNDLIQYLLAVDRSDPRVSALYQPLHPAVLRVIRQVVEAAGRAGVPVSVCGEMGSDPLQALVLLGLGVRELSMNPAAIPRIKSVLRAVRADEAAAVALSCLALPGAAEVDERLTAAWGALLTGQPD